ncbi:hypothetical protein [Lysinibacillus sphaericus]|uniref:hypothetical protein n=1 Tax=Lysinibacillus sphaericus TaxID=1421 RepID=UPI003D08F25F
MANNKLSGDVYIFECLNCKSEFHTKSKLCDGLNCPSCKGCLNPKGIEHKRDENEVVAYAKYECLSCNHSETVRGERKDYKEALFCPKCKGLFVDIWKIRNYEHLRKPKTSVGSLKIGIDVSNALKGLKAVERQAKNTVRALREVETITNKY